MVKKHKGFQKINLPEEGNPYTLLSQAFLENKIEECLNILTNIHFYILRKKPPVSLKKQWKKELSFSPRGEDCTLDFVIKIIRNRTRQSRCYFIRMAIYGRGKTIDCGLEYSNESNTMGIECAPHLRIANRGLQIQGMRL